MERHAAQARALRERHHNFRHFSSLLSALYFGGLGILGTSNFRAPLELFLSVFQDELLILR
jgi:hypothetical protein